MATIKLLLGIICFTATGSFGMFMRGMLIPPTADQQIRTQLVNIASKEIGVREQTGNNDGPRVEQYLAAVKLKKGQPWCAAWVSWVYAQAGLPQPRSGWSPDLFPSSRITPSALPGDVLGIYFADLKRIAHVGLVVERRGDWVTDLEGNTNITGGREGDGVYKKMRHIKTIYQTADWVSERRKKP